MILACAAALQWGTQPVILKVLVRSLDVHTIGWIRLLSAGLLLAPWVIRRRGLQALLRLRGWALLLLVFTAGGLIGNYLTFMASLTSVSPGTAQVLVQLGPMLVLLGGLAIYGESLSRCQWAGLGTLVAGLALFFRPRFDELTGIFDSWTAGLPLLLLAAVLWALYMLTQKQLLSVLRPETILFVIFATGAVVLLPGASPSACTALDGKQLALLAASCVLTAVSYICYATALEHVEVSRIGVILSLSPLIVFAVSALFALILPALIQPERLTATSIGGAVLVVAGSILGAFGTASQRAAPPRIDR